ncbi:MAG TPA: helix-turn-helix domain-containing protein [Saprospiraceae bacterium]|nr:helix-turn-helix domain-containing protein [Saprospiraceae bacterium]HPN71594.1 helix-turn-helix domain-containing protein [Saprospiraceae bacterium]
MQNKTFNYYKFLQDKAVRNFTSDYLLLNAETYEAYQIDFPFRATFYGIGINYGAETSTCKIGSKDYFIGQGSLITIGPGIVSQWQNDFNTKNETLLFNENILKEFNFSFLKKLPFFLPGGNHVVQIESGEVEKLLLLFSGIKAFINHPDVVSAMIYGMLKYLYELHTKSLHRQDLSVSEQVTWKFNELLAKYFIEHKSVNFYASKLNITPKYLSEILVESMGKSAKELINDHILWEAKSCLKQTTMTIQEISFWLGFEEPSYFVRMFKKSEGITPLAYRNAV